jgi:hypothetical protein
MALSGGSPASATQKSKKIIDEFDPANIKLAHRVSIRATDDDLLFLKQIGLRYVRAEVPEVRGWRNSRLRMTGSSALVSR